MILSAVNLKTMVDAIYQVFTGKIGVTPADAYILKLIALYMLQDDNARGMLSEHIRARDKGAARLWKHWLGYIETENSVEAKTSQMDVMEFLWRIQDGDNGEGS